MQRTAHLWSGLPAKDAVLLVTRYVLAVDPGLATGLALIDRATLKPEWVWEGAWEETTDRVARALVDHKDDIDVVIEKFTITIQTAKHAQAPWSLEVIGMVKLLCKQYGYKPENIKMQSPGDAKAFTDNDKLRRLDWWVRGSKGHGHDAGRHAALHLLRTGVREPILLE